MSSEVLDNENRDDLEDSLTALLGDLATVVEKRREIGTRLSSCNRKERAGILEEHREVKQIEYALELKVAELKLSNLLSIGTPKQIDKQKIRVNRLQSRMQHGDWLLWTRSIWKFKEMESKARTGLHPAQFSSVVPNRLIQMFSFVGDTILDPFIGTGTTCIEANKLARHAIGVDINQDFIDLAHNRIHDQKSDLLFETIDYKSTLHLADARRIDKISDSSIDLVVTHPPYWNCVQISEIEDDLSNCGNDSYEYFLLQMKLVIQECFRTLKPDRVAAFMVGDIMRKVDDVTQLFPFHADLINLGRQVGFIPWDIYIVETKMRNSGGMPMMGSYPYPHKIFSQFAHNYIIVLRKPAK